MSDIVSRKTEDKGQMWMKMRKKIFIFYFTLCFSLALVCVYRIYHSDVENLNQSGIGLGPSSLPRRHDAFSRSLPRDIHVVVGYYQGNNLPWITNENLTQEILNTNMYSPDPKSGSNGEAVLIPSFESPKMNTLFQINRFNLMASDRIPLNRTLPDVRRKDCRAKSYNIPALPTTSIIIVFHNEAWSTLLRTVMSVINRSPLPVVSEIILVDDASQRKFLRESLEKFVSKLEVKVRIIRSPIRIGLIKARLLGAKEAKGQVLTFLDAHCECTIGWLEPLLERVRTNRKSIVSPVIDIINDETFQYVKSFELHQGGFNWELHFRWFPLPSDVISQRQDDPTQPFKTPVIAGGLFSMDKDFFYELGSYDEHMEIWGGENLEISFRGWMCGAQLEIVPCSHVGHLFRKSSPYSFPGGVGDILNSNLARVALVWMDEWKDFYFKLHPEVAKHRNQSITSRLELRSKLNCKSFAWYLKKIWPGNFLPGPSRIFGKVRNLKSGKCLTSPRTKTFGQPYGLATVSDCIVELYAPQLFVLTPDGYLKTDDLVCLDPPEFKNNDSEVRIMACNSLPRQKWSQTGQQLVHDLSGKCLDLPLIPNRDGGLTLRACDGRSRSQQWSLENVTWKDEQLL